MAEVLAVLQQVKDNIMLPFTFDQFLERTKQNHTI